tara:strand:+ start:763 stop:1941 length:1179 start_codon:yes stop_codon:yes gene_type:complete
MSDSNTSSLAFIAETTPGTTPASPDLTLLRYTGEDLRFEKETVQSQEIRSDRQIPDLVKVHQNPLGGFNFELSYEPFKTWIEAAMFTTLNTVSIVALTVAFDTSADTITATATDFADVTVGMLLKITDAADTGNNGLKRIIAKNADSSVLTTRSGEITDTNASDPISLNGIVAVNGTTKKAKTFEKKIENPAGTDFFQTFLGMLCDTLSLTISASEVVTGSAQFIGQTAALGTATIDQDAAYTAAPDSDIVNGTNNFGNLTYKGLAASEKFMSINLDLANNLRGKRALGTEGNFDVGTGTFQVTGSINAYFLDNDWLTDVQNHNDFALEFSITDPDGNAMYFWLPRCKFNSGDPVIEGINSDVMIDAPFTAIRDDSNATNTGITLAVDFIPA